MARSEHHQSSVIGGLAGIARLLMMLVAGILAAHAQTYTVIHSFSGAEGAYPDAGLTMDKAGNFYGTASFGGTADMGTVFKLAHAGSGWTVLPLYSFANDGDGANPLAPVTIGPDGSLFGTTIGYYDDQGTLFNLRPLPTRPPTPLTPWTLKVLTTFTGQNGDQPVYGRLIFDSAGNLYGTTQFGGSYQFFGVVYEASPYGNGWQENVLYSFVLPTNGPLSGVVMDPAGNLFGTTGDGSAIFELSPSGSGWVGTILHTFGGRGDGFLAYGGLVRDTAGNLYGATSDGSPGNGGVVYELSPYGDSWTYQIIYRLVGSQGPFGELTLDAAGNLYGLAKGDGSYDAGLLFELTPSNGSWIFTDLHDFHTESFPYGNVTIDADGNLWGTASAGGAYGKGAIWEVTP